jgi:glycosyltransferase XagB
MQIVEDVTTAVTPAFAGVVACGAGASGGEGAFCLPPEIGFLLLHGVPAAQLSEAAAIAHAIGVTADRVVIARALMPEEAFYRALARHLEMDFLSRDFAVAEGASQAALRAGFVALAPGAGPRFALAPQGVALKILLERRRLSRLPGAAITTPTLLRRSVWAAIRTDVMVHAATGFAGEFPLQSARGGASMRQKRGAVAAIATTAFGVATLGIEAVIAMSVLACLLFSVEIALRLAATCETLRKREKRPTPLLGDEDLPTCSLVVALYRETAVAPQLAAALTALDYPREKLDILIMLEAGDEPTKAALEAQDFGPQVGIIVCPPGEPRTKPRALNAALALARGELLVVYDAEDIPDPAQLKLAAAHFQRSSARLACLQARLVIDNTADSLLARFFTIEYAALFDVLLPGLARLGCPLPLGGTSNHFRTRALKDVMGWDAWNVTEDADLGLRLARAGYQVETLASDTLEEAPSRLKPWLHQRSRWLKGWMQTAIVHSRNPRVALANLGLIGYIAILIHTVGTVATALTYPFFTVLTVAKLWDGSLLAPTAPGDILVAVLAFTVFAFGALSMLAPALVALHRRRLYRLLPLLPLLPFYYMLVSVAAWRAVFELLQAPTQWNKTEHGLARTSRSRPALPQGEQPQAARAAAAPKRP